MEVFEGRSKRGFRGFSEFYEGGVRTEYLKSVFPAEDFPAWRSISTGNLQ